MSKVLQLNADYTPIRIVDWQHAVELVLGEKAIVVESDPNRFVRSEKLVLPWPEVVALRRYKTLKSRVKFSGRNVTLRDRSTCQYCGFAPMLADGRVDRESLTLDHVVPRAQSKHGAVYLYWSKKWVNVTSWENATTACKRCNVHKADRTPAQAGMELRAYPRVPTAADAIRMSLAKVRNVPASWGAYLPSVADIERTRVAV